MTRLVGALAVSIIPKPAFAEWVKCLLDFLEVTLPEDDEKKLLRYEADWIFVFPFQPDANRCVEFVRNHYKEIFEAILASWDHDKRLWPQDISYEQFDKYFSVTFHSAIYDLASE